MRNVTSHGLIVTFLFWISEYTNLVNEAAHRLHAENLKPEWLNVPHPVLSAAFAVLCLTGAAHFIPFVARVNIIFWQAVLAIHKVVTEYWLSRCKRTERWVIETLKAGLWKVLSKIEDHTERLKKDNQSPPDPRP